MSYETPKRSAGMPPVVQGAKWTGGIWFLNMSRKEVDSFGLLAVGLLERIHPGVLVSCRISFSEKRPFCTSRQ
jgi:hypothetical protein